MTVRDRNGKALRPGDLVLIVRDPVPEEPPRVVGMTRTVGRVIRAGERIPMTFRQAGEDGVLFSQGIVEGQAIAVGTVASCVVRLNDANPDGDEATDRDRKAYDPSRVEVRVGGVRCEPMDAGPPLRDCRCVIEPLGAPWPR